MATNASMNAINKTATPEGDKRMNTTNLIRWAGVAAMVAGISYVVVGVFHPPNIVSSVTTTQWAIVHVVATANPRDKRRGLPLFSRCVLSFLV